MARRLPSNLADLETTLGHTFADKTLIERALTHISFLPGTPAVGPHYQRLEFLGDRVLGLCVADLLCRTYPDATEGELSRRLAHLVRRETCLEVALEWNVEPHLRLGKAERQAGLGQKEALLADVCEAIIASVYIDAGFAASVALVERFFGSKMAEPGRAKRDAKSELQEWALGRALPVPVYRETGRSGPDHAPVFEIAAIVEGFADTQGSGPSKRVAEQAAASAFLKLIRPEGQK